MKKFDKKILYELDKAASEKTNGVYTEADAEPELKGLRVRSLIEYCKRESKDISKISKEEMLQFCKDKKD